eukprot:TRINITY_DN14622_c0_g1_i1.p1 TRINITY_DN14622_c0_g1~~TRINITY_DN14622_c0_g1_i1.p1  ORF type:complete len:741 (-),score=68.60 TRINITY_DN14622_c0_g1_i1:5-2227(-)
MCRSVELYVSPPPPSLLCGIGKGVLVEAVSLQPCGHSFCSKCLSDRMRGAAAACPVCAAPIQPDSIQPNTNAREAAGQLETRCDNLHKGCSWQGTAADMATHIINCLRRLPVVCDMCTEKVPREEITAHFSKCPKRTVVCQHCSAQVQFDELASHQAKCGGAQETCPHCSQVVHGLAAHKAHCPQLPVSCAFGCGTQLPKRQMQSHEQACPEQPTICNLCKSELKLRELEQHKAEKCGLGTVACQQCGATVQRSELQRHMQRCGATVACDLCQKQVPKAQLMQHISAECPKHIVHCPHCPARLEREELQEKHQPTCPLWPVTCEHCQVELKRQALPNHQLTCVQAPVQCKQCDATLRRGSLGRHNNSECPEGATRCPDCSLALARKALPEHAAICGSKLVTCSSCGKQLKSFELHEHVCAVEGAEKGSKPSGASETTIVQQAAQAQPRSPGSPTGTRRKSGFAAELASQQQAQNNAQSSCPFTSVGCPGTHTNEAEATQIHMRVLLSQVVALRAENAELKRLVAANGRTNGTTPQEDLLLIDNRLQVLENAHHLLHANTRLSVGSLALTASPGSLSPHVPEPVVPPLALNATPATFPGGHTEPEYLSPRPVFRPASPAHEASLDQAANGEENDDGRVQCPSCLRKFNSDVAERHIPICKGRPKAMPSIPPALAKTMPARQGPPPPVSAPSVLPAKPGSRSSKAPGALPAITAPEPSRRCPECGHPGVTKFCVKCGKKLPT